MTTQRPARPSVTRLMERPGLNLLRQCGSELRAPLLDALESRTLLSLAFVPGPVLSSINDAPGVLVDLDGDGDQDLAASSGTNVGMLQVFLNNGTGNFTFDAAYDWGGAVVGHFPDRIRALDFDNDGDQDFITNAPALWINRGDGTFDPPVLIPVGILARDLVVFNYDGNARPDLAIVEPTGTFKVLVNLGTGFATGEQFLIEPGARFLNPGRVNADARQDIIYYTGLDNAVRTVLNTTNGLTSGPQVTNIRTLPVSGDFNADTFADLIWVDDTAGQGALMTSHNTGATSFEMPRRLRSTSPSLYSAMGQAGGDFDADGIPDLIVLRRSQSGNAWVTIPGSAQGLFDGIEEVAITISSGQQAGSVLVGRVDAGNRADIVRHLGSSLSTHLSVLGPNISALIGPGAEIVPGQTFTLGAEGLVQAGSRTITSVDFYEDSNQNNRLDIQDLRLGSVAPTGVEASLTSVLGDRRPWGPTRYFALARDSAGRGEIRDVTLTLWTRLFFPEGWRNIANVNEHVPMANDNNFDVQYRVVLRYEIGVRDQVFETGVIPARSRGGVTTALRGVTTINVRPDEAYAFEVQTSAPISAQLARYDTFNIAIAGQGESFTNRTATQWGFAHVTNKTLDFILIYNPFPETAEVTLDFYRSTGGSPIRLTRTVEGYRRGGMALQLESLLPANSDFSVVINSTRPIVVSESRYAPLQRRGMATLGQELNADPNADGSVNLVLPSVDVRPGVNSPAVFFNPGTSDVLVNITGVFDGTTETTSFNFVIAPKQRRSLELAASAPSGATVGSFRISSNSPVYVSTEDVDATRLDSLSTTVASYASDRWAFGDGWLDTGSLGVNSFAHITLYNPTPTAAQVTLTFLFDPGEATRSVTVTVPALSAFQVNLHQTTQLITKPLLDWYATSVTSTQPIIAAMTHWDLFQPGGWKTLGVALGDLVSLDDLALPLP